MRFEFATATRIIFGSGTAREVVPLASEMGERVLVVTGSTTKRAAPLLEQLDSQGLKAFTFNISDEPTIDMINSGVKQARETNCDVVIGFGGGSVLDAGKAISALLTNRGTLLDYLEVIGGGKSLTHPPVPYIAVPTTAGTGTEVTRNAVLTSLEHQVKVSLRSSLLLPALAIVDPEFTYSMPPELTANTGLDALTQLMEPFVSTNANPLSDIISKEGMHRIARSLRRAYENGNDVDAREDMSLASLFGGLTLANAGLGAVHGFAGVIGGMFRAPHGAICARLLPFVMEANIKASETRKLESSILLNRYRKIAQILTGKASARATDGIKWVHQLCEDLNIPRLSNFGLTEAHFATVVAKSQQASSMKKNPISLTDEELTNILKQAL